MDIVEETTEKGVVERRFDLAVEERTVPGIHWLPEAPGGPHPTVLIGHGGTQHKRVPNVLALARQLVRHLGVGVVALDAPAHGDRITDPEAAATGRAGLEQAIREGESGRRAFLTSDRRKAIAAAVPGHVREWKALIDDLQTDPHWAGGPFGWWGVSMGTTHGLPLVATEPRITCAVLGLNAVASPEDPQAVSASKITVPVLFLLQSEDELMTRDAGIALWDALGSTEKSLHLNPGGHVQIPRFERDAAEAFFARHLLDR